MPRRCTVCDYPDRLAIDRSLVERRSTFREIAAARDLSESAVHRHASEHVPAQLTRADDARVAVTANLLLRLLTRLYACADAILARAETAGDDKLALGAIRESGRLLAIGLRAVEVDEIERRLSALEEES